MPELEAFEVQRRDMIRRSRALPVKDQAMKFPDIPMFQGINAASRRP